MQALKALNTVVSQSGVSKTELARKLGRGVNYISNYSVKGNIPRIDTFAAIADVSGFDLIVRRRSNGREIIIDPPED